MQLYSFLAVGCACVGFLEITIVKLTAFFTPVQNYYKNKSVSRKPNVVLVKESTDVPDEKPQNNIVDAK